MARWMDRWAARAKRKSDERAARWQELEPLRQLVTAAPIRGPGDRTVSTWSTRTASRLPGCGTCPESFAHSSAVAVGKATGIGRRGLTSGLNRGASPMVGSWLVPPDWAHAAGAEDQAAPAT